MRSSPNRAPPFLLILVLLTPLFAGCAGARHITVTGGAFNCAKRIPPQLRDDVPGAPLPDGTQGGQAAFGDAQTGQLEQANDEKRTVIWIVDHCEAEKSAAAEELKPRPWWRFF